MYLENTENLKQRLLEIQSEDNIRAIMLLGSDKNRPDTDELKIKKQ